MSEIEQCPNCGCSVIPSGECRQCPACRAHFWSTQNIASSASSITEEKPRTSQTESTVTDMAHSSLQSNAVEPCEMRDTYSFQPPWYMQGRYVLTISLLLALLAGINSEPMYRDPISGKTMTVEEYTEVLAEQKRKQEEIDHWFHEQVLEAEKRSQYQDVHNEAKPRKNARRTHSPSGLSLGSKKDAEERVRDSIYKSKQVLSDGVPTRDDVAQ